MLQNHPTFYIALFAIGKIGALPAFINTNLSENSLLHCIKTAGGKLFLFDPLYAKNVSTISEDLLNFGITVFGYGESFENYDLESTRFAKTITQDILNRNSDSAIDEAYIRGMRLSDTAILIYTSGTTGLPKAARISNLRLKGSAFTIGWYIGIKKGMRIYCALPLYHSSGSVIGSIPAISKDATVVLARKFSASRFWEDCTKYKVDTFMYIGEFCRYLLSQPYNPNEKKHRVKTMLGNGLRPDIWHEFRERFNIKTMVEFYGGSENPILVHNTNTGDFGAGAVGRYGILKRLVMNYIQIVKVDPTTQEPIRDKSGLCIPCNYNENGELLVKLGGAFSIKYSGYHNNNKASRKKVIENVFKKGDVYFRSGDLLRQDSDGFFYFADRLGDTFRWKSENVATTEVEEVLNTYPAIEGSNVFGVLIPGYDGRAGMASLIIKEGDTIDYRNLYEFLDRKLPKYAVPLFLRIQRSMEMTGTFKQQKIEVRNQGINLEQLPESDSIYWLRGNTYVLFTEEDLNTIKLGKIRL
ncbi:hypothetical protein BY458DRAFT_456822 [Sporodiniella umbellata]|nr:hypothetical protein BY458DRAFT_456822 [Sporodiniella umbellata]